MFVFFVLQAVALEFDSYVCVFCTAGSGFGV